MEHLSRSLEETRRIASDMLLSLVPGDQAIVLALSGDLGAGKTAFAQAVGDAIGVEGSMQSPTFVIEKVYEIDWKGFKHLIHIDAYRLEKESELEHLGWRSLLADPENLIVVEWPEKVAGLIPSEAKKISFTAVDEHSRTITHA